MPLPLAICILAKSVSHIHKNDDDVYSETCTIYIFIYLYLSPLVPFSMPIDRFNQLKTKKNNQAPIDRYFHVIFMIANKNRNGMWKEQQIFFLLFGQNQHKNHLLSFAKHMSIADQNWFVYLMSLKMNLDGVITCIISRIEIHLKWKKSICICAQTPTEWVMCSCSRSYSHFHLQSFYR